MKKIFFCLILLASASVKAKSFKVELPAGFSQVTSGKCVSSDDLDATGATITLSSGQEIKDYKFGDFATIADGEKISQFRFPCAKYGSSDKNFDVLSAYSNMDIDVKNGDVYKVDLSPCFDTIARLFKIHTKTLI